MAMELSDTAKIQHIIDRLRDFADELEKEISNHGLGYRLVTKVTMIDGIKGIEIHTGIIKEENPSEERIKQFKANMVNNHLFNYIYSHYLSQKEKYLASMEWREFADGELKKRLNEVKSNLKWEVKKEKIAR